MNNIQTKIVRDYDIVGLSHKIKRACNDSEVGRVISDGICATETRIKRKFLEAIIVYEWRKI